MSESLEINVLKLRKEIAEVRKLLTINRNVANTEEASLRKDVKNQFEEISQRYIKVSINLFIYFQVFKEKDELIKKLKKENEQLTQKINSEKQQDDVKRENLTNKQHLPLNKIA